MRRFASRPQSSGSSSALGDFASWLSEVWLLHNEVAEMGKVVGGLGRIEGLRGSA
ncbi:hypothetical protein VDG1235_1557 [Verrucomicrobiia bacterium DG1235]|nr:hypothetical protein VDG1235_1557 [Verrucomicrobiae bacterium DG1235]